MKTLEEKVSVVYRFRCNRCRSRFEMTEKEKLENDIKFDDDWERRVENEKMYGWKAVPHNLVDHFDCPVCGGVQYVRRNEMHKFTLMNTGKEIMDY